MKKILHRILSGLSCTSALFACTACYGMAQCEYVPLRGIVKNASGEPLRNICVGSGDSRCTTTAITNDDGEFAIDASVNGQAITRYGRTNISLHDCDSTENGWYADKDTTFDIDENAFINITMNVK